MGKLWDRFHDWAKSLIDVPPMTMDKSPVPELKMRTWRNEMLSDHQRYDLIATVNSPGWNVVEDLMESTMEGFITHLVELPPEEEKKVLKYHSLVHSAYLFRKSLEAQIAVYEQLDAADQAEALEIKEQLRAINSPTEDPIENIEALNRLRDPLYAKQPPSEEKPTVILPDVKTTPMDEMLKQAE
jgi:hypothetical protein